MSQVSWILLKTARHNNIHTTSALHLLFLKTSEFTGSSSAKTSDFDTLHLRDKILAKISAAWLLFRMSFMREDNSNHSMMTIGSPIADLQPGTS